MDYIYSELCFCCRFIINMKSTNITAPPEDIYFVKVDLLFRENGEIYLKGKKIATDMELVNALRKNFGLKKL